ncbi:MAG: PhoU domain-containing protein [Bryobacteraceae bacterium]|jgi:phosphate transport system protein
MMRKHFVEELEAVRQNLIDMGENTIALLAEANRAIAGANGDTAEHASELEAQTDHQHRMIHDQCLSLITLQAPVARDARLVTGILDAIVDLELIGDYAYEIVTLSTSMSASPSSQEAIHLAEAGGKIKDLLSAAIDAWRTENAADRAGFVRSHQAAMRAECEALYEKLSKLLPGPGDVTAYVNLLLVCKHLERILRHAVCVADQAADAAGTSAVQ